jgi:hypothetical protein
MEWLTIVAILLGPILAVQAQKFVERRGAQKQRKLQIFKTLMATRGTVLSPLHVEALNLIDVEFTSRSSTDKRVLNAWALYRDHLRQSDEQPGIAWFEKSQELLTRLLYEMGQALAYEFDEVHIKRGAYVPQAHFFIEQEQNTIRREFVRILKGEAALPMKVTDFPNVFDEDYTRAAIQEVLPTIAAAGQLSPPSQPAVGHEVVPQDHQE